MAAMAILLHLETATTNCSVGISKDDQIVVLKENNAVNYSHSEQLHVFIKEALKEASLSFTDLDAVAVSKGPGFLYWVAHWSICGQRPLFFFGCSPDFDPDLAKHGPPSRPASG